MLRLSQDGVIIYQGDCLGVLGVLESETVHICVTSPPYWGLRDYGVEGQLGLEATPELYVEHLVEIFEEVRRVLREDGTLWLNLGDSYQSGRGMSGGANKYEAGTHAVDAKNPARRFGLRPNDVPIDGIKPKDLVGIPWMVAFALRAAGWYLRQEIIWHKPAPMPESVRDRCTKAHESIFLLAKSQRYYFDADAIAEPVSGTANPRGSGVNPKAAMHSTVNGIRPRQNASFSAAVKDLVLQRNKRSVWTVNTKPYPGAHFATFPPKLIEPCILAGCPEGGTVLDPFLGSGTTAEVAQRLGRACIGIELNPEYCDLAAGRFQQRTLF